MKSLGHVLFLVLLLAALVAGGTSTPTTDVADAPVTPAASTLRATVENQVITLANVRRAARGCPALRYRWSLVKAARNHSDRMADADRMAHRLYGEPRLGVRVTRAGYTGWERVAENIGFGYYWPWEIVKAWMNSLSHRHVLLDCGLRHVGVGMVYRDGVRWWTMDLGRQ